MTHRRVVEALRRQYFWIDSHFNDLFAQCASGDEKNALRAACLGSRDNLKEARLRVFIDRDPTAAILLTEVEHTQERLEAMAAAGFSAGMLQLIGSGVSAGSRLLTCGGSAAF